MISLVILLKGRGLTLADLARKMSVDKATATRWAQKRVPAERVIDVERVTGVPRSELRPDLYPSSMSPSLAPEDDAVAAGEVQS